MVIEVIALVIIDVFVAVLGILIVNDSSFRPQIEFGSSGSMRV